MKTLLILILSIIHLFFSTTSLSAQQIVGKWFSAPYQEEINFHEDGIVRMSSPDRTIYGYFQVEENRLGIMYFDESNTQVLYTFEVDPDNSLQLVEAESGVQYVFSYFGEAEIPEEVLKEFRSVMSDIADSSTSSPPADTQETISTPTPDYVDNHGTDLPGKASPQGYRGTSGIVGTWKMSNVSTDPEILTLCDDGYFMLTHIPNFPDLFPATFGYGKYSFENNTINLNFFNQYQIYGAIATIPVADLNPNSFKKPYDFYGETRYFQFDYQGVPNLSMTHRKNMLAWDTFLRLQGEWKGEQQTLKFMDSGLVIRELPDGKYFFSEHSIEPDEMILQLKYIDAADNDHYYKGKIVSFTKDEITLQNIQTGTNETLHYNGEPILTSEQNIVFRRHKQAMHQSAMQIIDGMDGVRDWIWETKKY